MDISGNFLKITRPYELHIRAANKMNVIIVANRMDEDSYPGNLVYIFYYYTKKLRMSLLFAISKTPTKPKVTPNIPFLVKIVLLII
jgi:hypothetical protein